MVAETLFIVHGPLGGSTCMYLSTKCAPVFRRQLGGGKIGRKGRRGGIYHIPTKGFTLQVQDCKNKYPLELDKSKTHSLKQWSLQEQTLKNYGRRGISRWSLIPKKTSAINILHLAI